MDSNTRKMFIDSAIKTVQEIDKAVGVESEQVLTEDVIRQLTIEMLYNINHQLEDIRTTLKQMNTRDKERYSDDMQGYLKWKGV